jgi:hypothetical protein
MRKCAYCGKKPLPKGQRKYCDAGCADKFKLYGPAREQYVYNEVEPDVEMTKKGAWLLVRSSQTDEEAIGDFMRVWKRPPDHVIYDPKTPFWKFVGPIWDEEELNHRWRVR